MRESRGCLSGGASGVTIVLIASVAAPARACGNDVYFDTRRYTGGKVEGGISATNYEFTLGPGSCNPSIADCRAGPATSLTLERGGQFIATSQSQYAAWKPYIYVVPQADRAFASVAGNVAVVAVDRDQARPPILRDRSKVEMPARSAKVANVRRRS